MKFNLIISFYVSLTAIFATKEWGYDGSVSPEHWGDLKPEYNLCKTGKKQSPIALNKATYFKTKRNYLPGWKNHQCSFEYINNGHSLNVDLKKLRYTFNLDCKNLTLTQFHIHTPAEHTINGMTYDLEIHFVYSDKEASLFQVFGVLFQVTKLPPAKGFFKSITNNNTTNINVQGSKIPFSQLNLHDLYIQANSFKSGYVYRGSLTTPPCTEAVRFIISDKVLPISQEQLDVFKFAMDGHTARPIQPMNSNRQPGILDFPKCRNRTQY